MVYTEVDVGGAPGLTWYLSECTASSEGRGDETHEPLSRLMCTENTDCERQEEKRERQHEMGHVPNHTHTINSSFYTPLSLKIYKPNRGPLSV